ATDAPAHKMYVARIPDAATFEAYSKEVGGERFGKFVLDMRTNAIYYFDVTVYPVHKDFIFAELLKKPKTDALVKRVNRNYYEKKPDFMMVYLVHHVNIDKWTFAYWPGDEAKPEHVRLAYRRIKETFYLGDKVKFRPDSDHQVDVAKRTKDVPFILNDELYKAQAYVAFNPGTAVGKLRLVSSGPAGAGESDLTFDPEDIVVLKTPLSDITPVAGIISETFSTPLAHVSLRAKGWGIPNIGLVDAHEKLAALDGKVVFFEAKGTSHVVRAATDAELAAAKARREAVVAVTLPDADLATTELRTLAKMREKDAAIFGPKAANLGEILHAKLAGFEVPAGFGIPFAYYVEHLRTSGLDKKLAALLADPAAQKDANVRKQKLEQLRAEIEKAPLAAELRAKVEAALKALPDNEGVFVRSSTNAEDLATFSGAGLHDTRPNVKGLDAVCDAIKYVWASTWTLRAYDARAHAKIDQAKVFGSALVQVGVPATAAGVVATVHPTDPSDVKNYTVNAKSGLGLAVVEGRKTPESLIVNWFNRGVRVLSRSDEDTILEFDETGGVKERPNPSKGKPVLTNARATHLAGVAKELTKLFKNDKLDIEWVYVRDKLYIVQTRPLVSY
ncbi:MAG: PEP/pyruvate-binding domain-containing protein, partial [Deltaproteobacteria bacterium]|nr:PEP/pyruvate-binding domain-containing protein [Deltaproteobacteria bacterium]